MKTHLDSNKIAKALGAVRRGKVKASGGFFGALQLLAEVEARFRVPSGGGRPTDPNWTVRRLVGMTNATLQRLEEIAKRISDSKHIQLNPMQVASILLESSIASVDDALDLADELPKSIQRKRAVGDGT